MNKLLQDLKIICAAESHNTEYRCALPFADVTKFGISGDGKTNNTKRINEVINEMKNGGILYFPPGRYITGSIILKNNMTLYLSTGAELVGSENKDDFPYLENADQIGYTRGGRYALIAAVKAKNIVIEGGGTINANGSYWWKNPEDQHRPRTIQTILCDNVKIKDITIKNSPMWTVHPVCCNNICIDGITIINPSDSPNTDGINPESCSNVRISNCLIDVGDDCITLKSGEETDLLQKRYPCENISITNCILLSGHGGIVIGSEMSGGVRNITVSNCIFNGTDRGIRIKTRRKRGGVIENLMFCDLLMTDVFSPFTINEFYYCGADKNDMTLFSHKSAEITEQTPVIKDINLNNITVRNATVSAIYIIGLPELPVKGVRASNISISTTVNKEVCQPPVMMPNAEKMQGRGVFLENIIDSEFNNIKVSVTSGEVLNVRNIKNVLFNGKQL